MKTTNPINQSPKLDALFVKACNVRELDDIEAILAPAFTFDEEEADGAANAVEFLTSHGAKIPPITELDWGCCHTWTLLPADRITAVLNEALEESKEWEEEAELRDQEEKVARLKKELAEAKKDLAKVKRGKSK
jgi:hypothetical protein